MNKNGKDKTPAEILAEAVADFKKDKIEMIALAEVCNRYASSHGGDVLSVFDKLSFEKQDNLAYAMANHSSDAALRKFDAGVLNRMKKELEGSLNTVKWGKNKEMAKRVQIAINGALVDKAQKDAEDALFDKLWGQSRLNTKEIDWVRGRIAKMEAGDKKDQMYLKLQEKVQYINQRNNTAYTREKAGGGSCALSSLAMCLSYLGLSIPERYRKEEGFPRGNVVDHLQFILNKQENSDPEDTAARAQLASTIGANITELAWSGKDRDWWEGTVRDGHLKKGHAVVCSIHGHIVRIQGVNGMGVVVDDPYGQSKLKKGKNRGWGKKNTSNREDIKTSPKETMENAGEDHVWSWEDVVGFDFFWIMAVSKK